MVLTCIRRLAAATLEHVETYIKPGVHTEALDDVIAEYVTSHDATNAPLNYRGFPKSSCISVNQVALQYVARCPSYPASPHTHTAIDPPITSAGPYATSPPTVR